MKNIILFLMPLMLLTACGEISDRTNSLAIINPKSAESATTGTTKLADYWYQGKAEISSYDLQQVRYRDVHPGEAVMIFVTEDFLTDKQVKNDNYTNKNSTPILKNNAIRRFTTGIYDYSIMTSVFTPTETNKYPKTQKVTISSQDWCGQSFMQINQKGNKYKVQLRSYFENEGDKDFSISGALLEDEIYNRIRMNPEALPTGDVDIIPSAAVVRLKHLKMQPVAAKTTQKKYQGSDFSGKDLMEYQIDYPSLQRTVAIVYQQQAPHIIEGWTDTYRASSGQPMTTKAIRKKTVMSPYWQQNAAEEVSQRYDLELSTFE